MMLNIVLFVLIATAPTGFCQQQAPENPSQKLQALQEFYWKLIMESSPESAYYLGVPHERTFSDLSPEVEKKQGEQLAEILKDLESLKMDENHLSRGEQVDMKLLASIVERNLNGEKTDLGVKICRALAHPVSYIQLRKGRFERAAGTSVEWGQIADILAHLPRYYRNLREIIIQELEAGKRPYRGLIRKVGIEEALMTADYFQKDLAGLAATALGPDHPQALRLQAEAGAAAWELRSLSAFLAREVIPLAKDDFAMGKEEVQWRLKNEFKVEWDIEELEGRLSQRRDEIAGNIARLQTELSREFGVPEDQVYGTMAVAPKNEAERNKWYQQAVQRAEGFVRRGQIMAVPADYKMVIGESFGFRAKAGGAYYLPKAVLREESRRGIVFLGSTGDDPDRLGQEHWPEILYVALHEAMPGHDAQFEAFSSFRNFIPKFRWLSDGGMNVEGWAVYITGLMQKKGFFNKAEEYYYWLRERGLVVSALQDLRLHAGRMTLEQAVSEAGLASRDEVLNYFYSQYVSPLYSLNYVLGKMEIERLRKDYRSAVEERGVYSEALFHEEFLKQGPIPVAYIRELLLQRAAALGETIVSAGRNEKARPF